MNTVTLTATNLYLNIENNQSQIEANNLDNEVRQIYMRIQAKEVELLAVFTAYFDNDISKCLTLFENLSTSRKINIVSSLYVDNNNENCFFRHVQQFLLCSIVDIKT